MAASKRPPGGEEALVALSAKESSSWRAAKDGYPYLLDRTELLASHGVSFFNGAPMFDQEPRAVYSDSCCHYNEFGNDILAEYAAKAILETVEGRQE